MSRRMLAALYLCCVWLCMAAPSAWSGEVFTHDLDADLYECTLSLSAGKALSADNTVRIALEQGSGPRAVILAVTPRAITIASAGEERDVPCGQVKAVVKPGERVRLTVLRRKEILGVVRDGLLVFRAAVPRGPGDAGAVSADGGWTIADIAVRQVEPVVFADDFMRVEDDPGPWTIRGGDWMLMSAWDEVPHGNAKRFNTRLNAQNPFAWVGKGGQGPALCTAGNPAWDDYTMSAAVRTPHDGAVGLVVNTVDGRNGALVRWSPGNDRGRTGNRLILYRVAEGRREVLAQAPGGYVAGEWYRMTVVSGLGSIRVLIDGEERMSVSGVSPWQGGVGLYAEGAAGAVFDDVTVYGRTLNTTLLQETRGARVNARFLDDPSGQMQKWAAPPDWQAGDDGRQTNRHDFYGDHWITLMLRPSSGSGRLVLELNADEEDRAAGACATIARAGASDAVDCTLTRDGALLAKGSGPRLTPGEDCTVRFQRVGSRLALEIDGEPVIEAADPGAPTSHRPAYLAEGSLAEVHNALALGRNAWDYTFSESPVDWIPEGTWMPTIRWSCLPEWSFYSGWSRGDAVLWQKRRFVGDQSVQVFMAYKMEYPREREVYASAWHYHHMCISICTDGRDPRSGYALMSGLPDNHGIPSTRSILYRNGVPVRTVNVSVPGWGYGHHIWEDLELRKRGATVEFWLFGALVLRYVDPRPIAGGVPAIWTTDNGISLARVRIHFENPPQPRRYPQVVLGDPWYPEWANVGRPLTLDFAEAMSTTGKPVALRVTASQAPDEQPLPAVRGKRATLTPRAPGDFWYQITGTDGKNLSPPFHLFLPAFTPALGRDDSRTLALYRFDEGVGAVVHDHAAIGPPLDLNVPTQPGSGPRWLPQQGLLLRGDAPLVPAGPARKLMAIRERKACTIEFWVSTDTVYSPTSWLSALMSWEVDPGRRNLLVGLHNYKFIVSPWGAKFEPTPNIVPNYPSLSGSCYVLGARTGLQHLAVTWDGTSTRMYVNGLRVEGQRGSCDWKADRWLEDARLYVGNQSDGARIYLGAIYLMAIHDRCLGDAEVKRHWDAGPSARDDRPAGTAQRKGGSG